MEPETKIPPSPEEAKTEVKEQPSEEEKRSNLLEKFWPFFLGAAVIFMMVILIFWILKRPVFQQLSPKTPLPSPRPSPQAEVDQATFLLEQQGASDDPVAIEADLKNTDLSNLDNELDDIDTELASP